MPLNRNYLQTEGNDSAALVYEHFFHEIESPHDRPEEIVILTRVLPSLVNMGYTGIENYVVSKLNGIPVQSLSHLKKLLEDQKTQAFYVFESRWNPIPLIFERASAERELPQILEQYGIPEASRISLKHP